jgi:hypothetical protein
MGTGTKKRQKSTLIRMKKRLSLHIQQVAQDEIIDAFNYYELQQKGLGDTFLKALDSAFKNIAKAPNGYQLINQFHRQYPMKKFPFVILYETDQESLFVDAVFHTGKNPLKKKR